MSWKTWIPKLHSFQWVGGDDKKKRTSPACQKAQYWRVQVMFTAKYPIIKGCAHLRNQVIVTRDLDTN